ncbi:SDR family NAD(P)-dependent oxidoreductase [Caballeronia sp. INDeC2]|uniref:SDR family oxidoreductase n=1 Tax=Caballeronia sp. INDeC2 TaxID=2921747 RepID=UPI00202915F9|nr:SDR family NAD(P)-dependent oxidoreductase [Caballeronia sp. INDeC2]
MNRIDLHGRVIAINGGARGLGYAVAERALRSGASVALWDYDAARLERSLAVLSAWGPVHSGVVGLTDGPSLERAVASTLDTFGALDALVNSAGITGGCGTTWDLSPQVWRRVIDFNLTGSFLACRAVVPQMIGQGYGRIVNVASIAGKEGAAHASHYSASAAGIIALTQSLGRELAAKNVLVNAVTPAAIRTDISATMSRQQVEYLFARVPMRRLLLPDEAASMIAWLASEECAFSTAAVFDLSGGQATF